MFITYALGTTAFLLCFVLTPLCRFVAIRLNLLDQPDLERKFHKTPVPRVGGFAIVASYAGALFLVVKRVPAGHQMHIQHGGLLSVLLPAAAVIFLTGLIDDLFNIKPIQKLLGQVAGAALLIGLGMYLDPGVFTIGTRHNSLSPWIDLPLTLIWLIACTNAVNLIDGMDGLAAGVGLLATITTLLAGLLSGNSGLVLATMPLAGALLAFLYYNFAPASIYLGDCGSLTIGFMLGAFSLVWSHHSGSVFSLAAPLMVLSLPLLDAGLAILRRYLRNVPIFGGDRGHIHHMIMARGIETRRAAIILYVVCGLAASLAILQGMGSHFLHVAILLIFVLLVLAGLQYLGYVEFRAAGRAILRHSLLRLMREEIYLDDLERKFDSYETPEEYWQTVLQVCEGLNFLNIEMYFHETYFHSALPDDRDHCDWSLTIPIGERGYLRLQRPNLVKPPTIAMSVIDRLQQALSKRERTLLRVETRLRDAA